MVFKYTPGIQNTKKDVGEEIVTYSLALIFPNTDLYHTCLHTQYMTVSPHLIPVLLGLPQFFLLFFTFPFAHSFYPHLLLHSLQVMQTHVTIFLFIKKALIEAPFRTNSFSL